MDVTCLLKNNQITGGIDTISYMRIIRKTLIQQVIRNFLYYFMDFVPTILIGLNYLVAFHILPTHNTVRQLILFLGYCTTSLDAIKEYKHSYVILYFYSDSSLM